ncbi:MAG: hypothetical protein QNJ14_19520 [Woeseiaceae bacterium]|nr:hypothetical protein [Woeseiaceae bacterium]
MNTETPREDYQIRCEDAVREEIRFMEGVREISFENSQADEFGDDEFDDWYWQATLVLSMEHRDRVYRIPVFSINEDGTFEFGDADHSWGDTERDLWRIIWVEEVEAHVETTVTRGHATNE